MSKVNKKLGKSGIVAGTRASHLYHGVLVGVLKPKATGVAEVEILEGRYRGEIISIDLSVAKDIRPFLNMLKEKDPK